MNKVEKFLKRLAALKHFLERYVWQHQEQEDEWQLRGEYKPKPTYVKKNMDIFNRNRYGFQKEDLELNYKALRFKTQSPIVPIGNVKICSLTPL